jgi:hypothetical protein
MTDKTVTTPATKIKFRHIAIVYALIGIFTFGHIAVNHQCFDDDDKPKQCRSDDVIMYAYMGTLGWPLYWSWKAQERI